MTDSAKEKTIEDALNLPATDRAGLIEKLSASFENHDATNYEAEWADKAERRLKAYDRGEMEAYSIQDVFDELEDHTKK